MAIRVHKALTPEEKLKLGSIMALCNELMGAEEAAAGEPEPPPPVEESVKKEEGEPPPAEPPKEEEVKKSEAANEDAEARMEELPADDEEALSVLKALVPLISKSIAKSAKPKPQEKSGMEMQVLGQTLQVMKSMQKRIDEQGQAINGILEGMGVTNEILKVEKASPRQAVQPSANDILAALASVVQKSAAAEPAKPETMRDALALLWNQ